MRRIGDVFSLLLLAALLCLPLDAAQAQARKRVALLVGNGAYASATTLGNPRNDVRLVAEAAKKAGFETVTIRQDLGMAAFQQALRDFRTLADGAEVAMVYYAGHGMEGNGRNWLIPVDAGLASDRDLPYEAINLDQVMEAIEGATLRMVVLDACRNNPFGRGWRGGTRAVSRGLGGVEADDVLVIYAAAPGQVAADGEGGNSPFATALASRLAEPGLPVQMLGGAVRDDVLAATGGGQRPFVSASITGKAYYLVRADAGGTSAPPASPAPLADAQALDLATWQGALAANSAAAFEDYLRNQPRGRFRVQAEQNLARFSADAAPVASVVVPRPASQSPLVGQWQAVDSRNTGVLNKFFGNSCFHRIEILSIADDELVFKIQVKAGQKARTWSEPVDSIVDGKVTTRFPVARKRILSVDGSELRMDLTDPAAPNVTCRYSRSPGEVQPPPVVR
jgi:uncharacterized caspase-like protein